MKADLVGIHQVKKRLADGSVKVYYYAWRGGPRMASEPFTNAFTAEYVRLTRDQPDAPYQGCMAHIIRDYLKSPTYTTLKPSTREGYDIAITAIETEFYDMTAKKISAPGTRQTFLQWRDEIAQKHPRKADLFMSVLKRILWFGLDREMIERHPLERVEKISNGSRRDIIWSDEDMAAFMASASEPLYRAMLLAAWTGQRQADLLGLTWKAYDGNSIYLRQGKGGALKENGETWADIVSVTISDEEIDRESGIGSWDHGSPFTAWSSNFVYFPISAGRHVDCGSAPRNPNGVSLEPQGYSEGPDDIW